MHCSGEAAAPVKPYNAFAVTLSAFWRLSNTARAAGSAAAFSCSRVALQTGVKGGVGSCEKDNEGH